MASKTKDPQISGGEQAAVKEPQHKKSAAEKKAEAAKAKEQKALMNRAGVKEDNESLAKVGASIARIPSASGFGLKRKRPQVRNYDPTGTIFVEAKDRDVVQLTPRERALRNLRAGMDPSAQTIFSGTVKGYGKAKLKNGEYTYYAKVNTNAGVPNFTGKIVNITYNNFVLESGTGMRTYKNPLSYLHAMEGAEVDFIVYNYDADDKNGGIILGSRIRAAEKKKMKYWFGKQNYQYIINNGKTLEARVVITAEAGITVEAFGIEFFIPKHELSYTNIQDCREVFSNGDKIKVKVKDLKRNQGYQIEANLSHIDTMEDTRILDMSDWVVGEDMKGALVKDVKMDEATGAAKIWVTFENKFDIYCKMADGIAVIPQPGETVDLTIHGKKLDDPRGPMMWGEIFHVNYKY